MANRYDSGNFLEVLKDHIQKYIITNPEDGKNLRMDIIGDESLSVESDVTDHYVESNTAYQDQISLKPKTYTISGEVGELVWYQRDSISQKVGQVAQRLEGVVSFLPTRSKGFQQMKKTAMKVAQWIDVGSNIWDRYDTLKEGMKNQQQSFILLLSWRDERKPLTITSPWGMLKDYVITSLKYTQPKDTKDKSLISITFKEFRTTSVSTVKFDINKYQGVAGLERQPNVDNGTTSGTDATPKDKSVEIDGQKVNLDYDKETGQIRFDGYTYDEYSQAESAMAAYTQDLGQTENIIVEYSKKIEDSIAKSSEEDFMNAKVEKWW